MYTEITEHNIRISHKKVHIKKPEVLIINIQTDIRSVTYLKSRAAGLLKQINDTRRPVIITQNGEPKAVLHDPKSFEGMCKIIGILKLISQGEEDIKKGNAKTQEEVFNNIEEMLKMKSK